MQISAKQLNELLRGELIGDPDVIVSQPARIEEAEPHQLSFIANPKYAPYAYKTNAGVLIVGEDFHVNGRPIRPTLIKVKDPYKSFTKLLEHYGNDNGNGKPTISGIEEPSYIAPSATIGKDAYIGAFSYIGENVVIGKGVKIFPQVYVGENVTIADGTIIYPGVKIYKDCTIGEECIIHAGVIIGSDGFGFLPQKDKIHRKVPQTGNVIIESHVEIGANCCIDRATMGSTIIRSGVKLDNLIQVAHNVDIGANTVIAAQTGVSGSTKLGERCMVGGQVGFVGHLKIADGAKIQAQSGISKSITEENKAVAGSPAFDYNKNLKSQVIFRNLPELEQRIQQLERQLHELQQRDKSE